MKIKLLLLHAFVLTSAFFAKAEQWNLRPLHTKNSANSILDVVQLGSSTEMQSYSNRYYIYPFFDQKGRYVGSVSQLFSGVYIMAAHVASFIEMSSADYLLGGMSSPLQMGSNPLKIYQFSLRDKGLDAVIVSKHDLNYIRQGLAQVFVSSEELQSLADGGRYQVTSLIDLNKNLVRQKSEGSFFFDLDFNPFLKVDSESYLNRGSSGALIETVINGKSKVLSLVRCAVQTSTLQNGGDKNVTYYKGLSTRDLLESDLVETSLDNLRLWVKNNSLVNCIPVSGKKGGGT